MRKTKAEKVEEMKTLLIELVDALKINKCKSDLVARVIYTDIAKRAKKLNLKKRA